MSRDDDPESLLRQGLELVARRFGDVIYWRRRLRDGQYTSEEQLPLLCHSESRVEW